LDLLLWVLYIGILGHLWRFGELYLTPRTFSLFVMPREIKWFRRLSGQASPLAGFMCICRFGYLISTLEINFVGALVSFIGL